VDAELAHLMAHDSDPFIRWEAGQRLALRYALQAVRADGAVAADILPGDFVAALRDVLRHPTLDAAYKDLVLTLPAESYIAEQLDVVDPQRIHAVRESMRQQLAEALQADWAWAFDTYSATGAYQPDPISCGRRALTGSALLMLCLAARTSELLTTAGYQVLAPTDATSSATTSSVYFTSGSEPAATEVAAALGLGATAVKPLPDPAPVASVGTAQVVSRSPRAASYTATRSRCS
jgi:aminopeptidase N